jgi:Fe-only nitrogenase accessory protein AnfO
MKIAILKNQQGEISDFFGASFFDIYEKNTTKWNVVKQINFQQFTPKAPKILRKEIEKLLPLISDCEIIAGKQFSGIPYSVFDMGGLNIFEIENLSENILDELVADVKNSQIEKNENAEIITSAVPHETSIEGIFELDLVKLQEKFPEISSKKALKDFLENTPFVQLNLICRHLPPWIENSGRYNINLKQNCANGIEYEISKKCVA